MFTLTGEDGLYLRDTLGFDANGISNQAIRLNGADATLFKGGITGFSSRGPVQGWGQVKPDVAAPGANVLAAVPPGSLMGALAAAEQGPSYGSASGTSMATPHMAGAAALVKQANPGWHPDKVRTALINTATMLRDRFGNPAPYGADNPPVNAQGGGLVDVNAAARARALLGVIGDGVNEPFILGSHSFGRLPILGNECENTEQVVVSLVDQRGNGGTYHLTAYPSAGTNHPGVSFIVPTGDVVVPAGGSVSFSTGVTIDTRTLDPEATVAEFQWYIVAERTDGTERLSMPFYLQGVPSVPGEGIGGLHDVTETFTGTNLGGNPAVVFLSDHDITVPLGTMRILAVLEGDELVDEAVTEVELQLIDAAGTVVAASRNQGNYEVIDYPSPAPGAYVVQVRGDTGGPVSFELTVTQSRVTEPQSAQLDSIAGDYVNMAGAAVDFDGAFTLRWSGTGAESGYMLEERRDGGSWTPIAAFDGGTVSQPQSGKEDGTYEYRIQAAFPGAMCSYVMPPGEVQSVIVDHRQAVSASGVTTRILSASFAGGVFSADVVLVNDSDQISVSPVTFDIVGISSGTNDVHVINADNGGAGSSPSNRASFGYSGLVGDDEALSPGEVSGPRTVRFADPSGQLFTFQSAIRAYQAALQDGGLPPARRGAAR